MRPSSFARNSSNGDIYFLAYRHPAAIGDVDDKHCVYKLTGGVGSPTVFAGNATTRGAINSTLLASRFACPIFITFDSTHNYLYVAEMGVITTLVTWRIRKIDINNGSVSTLAGGGTLNASTPTWRDGIGTLASFTNIHGMGFNKYDNYLYVGDTSAIRKVDISSGAVTVFVGDGTSNTRNMYVDSYIIPIGKSLIVNGFAFAFDSRGNIFVADRSGIIRKISALTTTPTGQTNYVVTTFAGKNYDICGNSIINERPSAITPYLYDDLGINAGFGYRTGTSFTIDLADNIYCADTVNNSIRKISPDSSVTTIAGSVTSGNTNGDGTAARFNSPKDLTIDSNGNMYIADTQNSLFRNITINIIPSSTQTKPSPPIFAGVITSYNSVYITYNVPLSDGKSNITNYNLSLISPVSPGSFIIDTTTYSPIGGNFATASLPIISISGRVMISGLSEGTSYTFNLVAINSVGTSTPATINITTESSATLTVSTFAGSTQYVATAGDILSSSYYKIIPLGILKFSFSSTLRKNIAVDLYGDVYVADNISTTHDYNCFRVISSVDKSLGVKKVLTTYFLDTSATVNVNNTNISCMAVDSIKGIVYVCAPTMIHTVERNVYGYPNSSSFRVNNRIAGSSTAIGTVDGAGTTATFSDIRNVAIDSTGNNLYVTQTNAVRKVNLTTSTYTVSTLCNTTSLPELKNPGGICVSLDGYVYFTDTQIHNIYRISPSGVVIKFAGGGSSGYVDDIGTNAKFNIPSGICVGLDRNLYVADSGNNRIRKITPCGVVSTLAGASSAGSNNAIGTAATFNNPTRICIDILNNLYVLDNNNYRIRKITNSYVSSSLSTPCSPVLSGTTTSTATTITFSFNAPISDGMSSLTGYSLSVNLSGSAVAFKIGATNYSAGQSVAIAVPATYPSQIILSGLDYSITGSIKTYNISLVANNSVGSSPALAISQATATISAPVISGTTTSTATSITFSFTAPTSLGGLTVSGYRLQVALLSSATSFTIGGTNYSAGQTATIASAGSVTISGLQNSITGSIKTYNLSLVATYSGNSFTSPALAISKDTATLSAPVISGTTSSTATTITFTFTVPTSLGGLTVSGYRLSIMVGASILSSFSYKVGAGSVISITSGSATIASAATVIVSGLEYSLTGSIKTYNISLAATYTTESFTSPALVITQATAIPTAPTKPNLSTTATDLTSTSNSITFKFSAPTNTGGTGVPITSYTLRYFSSTPAVTSPTFIVSAVSATPYSSTAAVTIIPSQLTTVSGSFPNQITISGLKFSTSYVFRLNANNAEFTDNSINYETITKDTTSLILTNYGTESSNNNDMYIVKYDSLGVTQWVKHIGGPGYDSILGMVLDIAGNIYIAGYFEGAYQAATGVLTIDGGPTITNDGDGEGFIVKYNSSGVFQQVKTIKKSITANDGGSETIGMVSDSSGNVYITLRYIGNNPVIYNNDGSIFTTLTNSGGYDIFTIKYNSNGNPQWARKISGNNADYSYFMKLDSSANVYLYGKYNSPILTMYNEDGSSFANLSNTGNPSIGYGDDIFTAKYNSDGTPQWLRNIGGGQGSESPFTFVLDSEANVFVGGIYRFAFKFYNADGSIFTELSNTPTGGQYNDEIFIAKYNSNGTPQWARRIGGSGHDRPVNMVSDSAGNIYVSASYNSPTVTMYGPTTDSNISVTNIRPGFYDINDTYIVKYSSIGTPVWARNIGGTGSEGTISIVVDSTENVYVSGSYTSSPLTIPAIPGVSPIINLTNSGGIDTFIVKYSSIGTPVWATKVSGTGNQMPANMALDAAGNLYISGYYTSATSIIQVSATVTLPTGNNSFIIKYSTGNGTAVWAKTIGGTGIYGSPKTMIVDSSSNVFLSGFFDVSSITFT